MTKDEVWAIVAKAIDYHGLAMRDQKEFDKKLNDDNMQSQREWQRKIFGQTRSMAIATWVMALGTWALFGYSLLHAR